MPTLVGDDLRLLAAEFAPADLGGPVDVPFEHFAESWIERPVFERFDLIAGRYADRTAVDDGVMRLTYGELMRSCVDLATRIDALVPSGAPVGIMLPTCALVPVAALACLAIGRPFVPLDCNYPAPRIAQIVAEAGMQAVLVDSGSEHAATLAASMPRIDVTASLAARPGETKISPAAVNKPAAILYTSGSTGRPKGICLDQRAISHRAAEFINSCHLHADDRIILLTSPGTVDGIRNIVGALLSGASFVIADPLNVGISGVLAMLQQKQITICAAIPALLRELMNADAVNGSTAALRVVRLFGKSAQARDVARLRKILPPSCHIQIAYGLTETGAIFRWFVPREWRADGRRMPCGYAKPGMSLWLRDADNGTPPSGELVVKSRDLMLGYWQDGRLQPSSYERDPDEPSLGILYTGDVIRIREDGLAEVVGRKDRQVKINGLRVNPGEVEDALARCDGVAKSAVIARHDDRDAATLIAFVVPYEPAGATFLKDLHAAIASRLPSHMRPAHIRLLSKIPSLPNFKPDIAALQRLNESFYAAADSIDAQEPPTRIKDAVEVAWAAVLGRPCVGTSDRWLETGGDSLKKLKLWLHVEKTLGIRIPYEPFGDTMTPNEIATTIERVLAAGKAGEPDQVSSPR